MNTNDILPEMSCPHCGHPMAVPEQSLKVECSACGRHYLVKGHLCPNCFTYHEEEAGVCNQCSAPMTQICQKCYTVNWGGNERCQQCKADLGVLANLEWHTNQATVKRLQEQMEAARHFKEIESEASNKRMAELTAIEAERQVELRRRLKKQREQERKMLLIAFGAVAFFLLMVVLYTFLQALV